MIKIVITVVLEIGFIIVGIYLLDTFLWVTFSCKKCGTRFYHRTFIDVLGSCEQCGYGNWANRLFEKLFKEGE